KVDFSSTDLRNASFDNAVIGGDVKFGGSSWWLAKGLPENKLRELRDRHPNATNEFATSRAFEKERNERLGDIANAVARGDVRRHIEALKDYAWVFATLGTDLEDAEKKALQAEEELSKLRPAEDHYQQEIDDTLSLIYLVKGDL